MNPTIPGTFEPFPSTAYLSIFHLDLLIYKNNAATILKGSATMAAIT